MVTRLIFVRHAEAEGNVKRLFHGWTDSDITEKGHSQAKLVADYLENYPIDVLYSSSLMRTLKTAQYISKVKNLPIIRTDKLKEINGGDWEDVGWEVLPEKWPLEFDSWENAPYIHQMPNGESMEGFKSRLVKEIDYIINNNAGKNICIVTHGAAIRVLTCYFHHCDLKQINSFQWVENTSVTVVEHKDSVFNVLKQGDTSHLDQSMKTLEDQEWWQEREKLTNKTKLESISDLLVNWLFETNALRVSSADMPFWYTSGTIGPYYINTHFLYGNEEKANELLTFINNNKDDIHTFPKEIIKRLWENYNSDEIYKGLIDNICIFIKNRINLDEIDYISGGERRDWFFSFLVAKILDKPHLTIYKDLSINKFYNNNVDKVDDLKGKNVLHIADLVTQASSYERAWIPAIKQIKGSIKWSMVIVDREQGGKEILDNLGVSLYPMVSIDKNTFDKALSLKLINKSQYNMLIKFIDDPNDSMREFLKSNPEFLQDTLSAGGKNAERAKLCIDNNIYDLR